MSLNNIIINLKTFDFCEVVTHVMFLLSKLKSPKYAAQPRWNREESSMGRRRVDWYTDTNVSW